MKSIGNLGITLAIYLSVAANIGDYDLFGNVNDNFFITIGVIVFCGIINISLLDN